MIKPAIWTRSDIERSVGRLLDAQSNNDVKEELACLAEKIDSAYRGRDDTASRADHHYARERARRQVILASLHELACRKAIKGMSRQFAKTRSLLPISQIPKLNKSGEFSPSSKLFIQAMNFWFVTAITEVIEESQETMPAKAIIESGQSVYDEYRNSFPLWKKHTRKKVLIDDDWTPSPSLKDAAISSLEENMNSIGKMIIGRGLAYRSLHPTSNPQLMSSFVREQLPLITSLSSSTLTVSIPIIGSELLESFADWENGTIDDERFNAQRSASTVPDGCYHASLRQGRYKKPGFCSGDVAFAKPELFPVHPEFFLRQLDIKPPEENINLVWVAMGAASVIAEETVFAHWPENS